MISVLSTLLLILGAQGAKRPRTIHALDEIAVASTGHLVHNSELMALEEDVNKLAHARRSVQDNNASQLSGSLLAMEATVIIEGLEQPLEDELGDTDMAFFNPVFSQAGFVNFRVFFLQLIKALKQIMRLSDYDIRHDQSVRLFWVDLMGNQLGFQDFNFFDAYFKHVAGNYMNVHYHNLRHGLEHSLAAIAGFLCGVNEGFGFGFMEQTGLPRGGVGMFDIWQEWESNYQNLALLLIVGLGGLAHDAGHPGVGNPIVSKYKEAWKDDLNQFVEDEPMVKTFGEWHAKARNFVFTFAEGKWKDPYLETFHGMIASDIVGTLLKTLNPPKVIEVLEKGGFDSIPKVCGALITAIRGTISTVFAPPDYGKMDKLSIVAPTEKLVSKVWPFMEMADLAYMGLSFQEEVFEHNAMCNVEFNRENVLKGEEQTSDLAVLLGKTSFFFGKASRFFQSAYFSAFLKPGFTENFGLIQQTLNDLNAAEEESDTDYIQQLETMIERISLSDQLVASQVVGLTVKAIDKAIVKRKAIDPLNTFSMDVLNE